MQNELLTVQEVATYLRVSRVTVWRWCKRGVIPAFQVGRNWRVRRVDLLNLKGHSKGEDDSVSIEPSKEGLRKSEKVLESGNIAPGRREKI